jgi:hypothetical protein
MARINCMVTEREASIVQEPAKTTSKHWLMFRVQYLFECFIELLACSPKETCGRSTGAGLSSIPRILSIGAACYVWHCDVRVTTRGLFCLRTQLRTSCLPPRQVARDCCSFLPTSKPLPPSFLNINHCFTNLNPSHTNPHHNQLPKMSECIPASQCNQCTAPFPDAAAMTDMLLLTRCNR